MDRQKVFRIIGEFQPGKRTYLSLALFAARRLCCLFEMIRARAAGDLHQQALEYVAVEREEDIPVGNAAEVAGIEVGRYAQEVDE